MLAIHSSCRRLWHIRNVGPSIAFVAARLLLLLAAAFAFWHTKYDQSNGRQSKAVHQHVPCGFLERMFIFIYIYIHFVYIYIVYIYYRFVLYWLTIFDCKSICTEAHFNCTGFSKSSKNTLAYNLWHTICIYY